MSAVYTIGHDRHSWSDFAGLLHLFRLDTVVDVRARPDADLPVWGDRVVLEERAHREGWMYRWMGRELGGVVEDEALCDADGHVRYDRLVEQSDVASSLDEVAVLAEHRRVVLLGRRSSPEASVRRHLAGRALAARGWEVRHVLADGSRVREVELRRAERAASGQLGLFEPRSEAWRSPSPVRTDDGEG